MIRSKTFYAIDPTIKSVADYLNEFLDDNPKIILLSTHFKPLLVDQNDMIETLLITYIITDF